MPRSGREARGDTISWPLKLRSANLVSPRAGVSLAEEHNPDRSPQNPSLIVQPTVLARTVFVKLKHAMNSGCTEIHRFALPKAPQTAIETRIGWEAELERWSPDLGKLYSRGCLPVSLSKALLCHARLKCFDLRLYKRGPREDSGISDQIRIQERAVALCHMAKGDPHRGHLRPELVSPVPPGLRKAIKSETRSVSFFLPRRGLSKSTNAEHL